MKPLNDRIRTEKLLPDSLSHGVHTYLLLLVSVLFLSASTTRTLNFDEWLAVRSGWLATGNVENNLNFLMPWTWAIGIFSRICSDPEITIISLRLTTTALVIWTLWGALNNVAENRSDAIKIFLLCFSSGAYVSHSFEIRYDAAIIILWVLAWNLTTGKLTGRTCYWIGIIISLLALHHTKGAFFATSLCLYILLFKKPDKILITKVITAIFITLLIWIALASITSNLNSQLNVYLQFYEIGRKSDSISIFKSLSERILQDWLWWMTVIVAIVVGRLLFRNNANYNRTLWFAITPAVFIAIHPRPWNYMLVPIIPFISYIAYENLKIASSWIEKKFGVKYSIATTIIAIAMLGNSGSALKIFNSSNESDLNILNLLENLHHQDDTVIDPTGAAYFIEPFDPDWYADTLFLPLIEDQVWMKKTQLQKGELATFIVMSYRLQWTNRVTNWLQLNEYKNVCGWLYLRKDDRRVEAFQDKCPINETGISNIENFW